MPPPRSTARRRSRPRLSGPERRAAIVEAAGALFAEHGYDRTSIDRIAEAAEITVPVIYDHFASKRDLYVAVLRIQAARLVEATTRVEAGAPLETVVRVNVEAFFEFVERQPAAWRMLFVDSTADPEIAKVHREVQAQATARLAVTVVAAAPALKLSVEVPRPLAEQMLAELGKSALNGLAVWWWEHPETPRGLVAAVAMDLLWRGVRGIARA